MNQDVDTEIEGGTKAAVPGFDDGASFEEHLLVVAKRSPASLNFELDSV